MQYTAASAKTLGVREEILTAMIWSVSWEWLQWATAQRLAGGTATLGYDASLAVAENPYFDLL